MNVILFSHHDKKGDEFVFYKSDDRYLHIKKILHLDVGSVFKCGIINGSLGNGIITAFNSDHLSFSFNALANPEPLFPIHLILGASRPIQLKRLIKDVSTMGITSIHIIGTILGEKSYFNSTLIEQDNITKYLVEGASQGGSTLIPSYSIHKSLDVFLHSSLAPTSDDLKLVFDIAKLRQSGNCFNDVDRDSITRNGRTIYFAIGSERGWAGAERDLFYQHGFDTITLGKRILRTETATIAALSYIFSKLCWY